jgi:hypothetical protein
VQASGSLDGSARVWWPAEGAGAAVVAVLEGHGGPVTALAAGADSVRCTAAGAAHSFVTPRTDSFGSVSQCQTRRSGPATTGPIGDESTHGHHFCPGSNQST